MANQKITELTELTTPADEDMLVIVDDPGGTPVTKKIAKSNLVSSKKTYPIMHSDAGTNMGGIASWGEINTAYRFTLDAAGKDYVLLALIKDEHSNAIYITYLRLYNVTDAADYGEISEDDNVYIWHQSNSFTLPSGEKVYTLQTKDSHDAYEGVIREVLLVEV